MKSQTPMRELRKNLKAHLDSGETLTIRNSPYNPVRAFIVSVPHHDHYSKAARRKALARAKRSFAAAIRTCYGE